MTDPQPTTSLPDEIEAAMVLVEEKWIALGRFDRIGDIFVAESAANKLRQHIATALAQARENSAQEVVKDESATCGIDL